MRVLPSAVGRTNARGARQKWKTIRYALDDTRRTVRFCVILLTMGVASVVPFLIIVMVRGYFG
jgi:hypothetical protein